MTFMSFGEMTAEQALLRTTAMRRKDRDDHDVGVERPHRLHAHELETQRAIRESLDGSQCGVRGDSQVAKCAGDSFGLPRDSLAFEPLELDFGPARAGRCAMEHEVREAKPFALELRLADDRTGVLARGGRRKHAGQRRG